MPTPTRLLLTAAATALLTGAAVAVAAAPAAAAPDRPGVVRNGNQWLLRDTLTTGVATTTFRYGSSTDVVHVTGDWDGNGTKTAGVVRAAVGAPGASNWVWYLRNGAGGGDADITPFGYGKPGLGFGEPGDMPIVGDWDGDGRDSVGVVRMRSGEGIASWLLRNSTTGGAAELEFGYGRTSGDVPVVGDWDGTGSDTPGMVRDGRTWLLRNTNSAGSAQVEFTYGRSTDRPIVGDWDGTGGDGIGMLRPSMGRHIWLLRNDLSTGVDQLQFSYGLDSDNPVVWQ